MLNRARMTLVKRSRIRWLFTEPIRPAMMFEATFRCSQSSESIQKPAAERTIGLYPTRRGQWIWAKSSLKTRQQTRRLPPEALLRGLLSKYNYLKSHEFISTFSYTNGTSKNQLIYFLLWQRWSCKVGWKLHIPDKADIHKPKYRKRNIVYSTTYSWKSNALERKTMEGALPTMRTAEY